MPDSTNVQLVAWDNARARTIADKIVQLSAIIAAHRIDYAAQGLAAVATTAGASNIADGYSVDGRQPVTGTQVINLKAALDQLDTALNVTVVPGVGVTVAAIVNGIQVNGSLR